MIIQLWVVPKGTVIIDNGWSFESLSRSYHQSWGWVIFQISWVRFVITNEQSINGQTPHLTLLMTSALFSEVSVTFSDNSWLQNYPTLCDQSAKQNVLQVTLRWFSVKLFCSIITELSKISAKNFYLHFQQFLFLETNWLSFNWQSPHFTWWIISAQVTGMSVTVRCIYQQQLITELLLLSFCHQTAQPFPDLIVNAPF